MEAIEVSPSLGIQGCAVVHVLCSCTDHQQTDCADAAVTIYVHIGEIILN